MCLSASSPVLFSGLLVLLRLSSVSFFWGACHFFSSTLQTLTGFLFHGGVLWTSHLKMKNDGLGDNSVKKKPGKTQIGRAIVCSVVGRAVVCRLKAVFYPLLPPTLSLLGKRPGLCLNLLFWITSYLHTVTDAHILFATSSERPEEGHFYFCWVCFSEFVGWLSATASVIGLLILSWEFEKTHFLFTVSMK